MLKSESQTHQYAKEFLSEIAVLTEWTALRLRMLLGDAIVQMETLNASLVEMRVRVKDKQLRMRWLQMGNHIVVYLKGSDLYDRLNFTYSHYLKKKRKGAYRLCSVEEDKFEGIFSTRIIRSLSMAHRNHLLQTAFSLNFILIASFSSSLSALRLALTSLSFSRLLLTNSIHYAVYKRKWGNPGFKEHQLNWIKQCFVKEKSIPSYKKQSKKKSIFEV